MQNQTPKAASFLPFGEGSRICPGTDLAKLQISIFLHYFLLDYKWVSLLLHDSFLQIKCKKQQINRLINVFFFLSFFQTGTNQSWRPSCVLACAKVCKQLPCKSNQAPMIWSASFFLLFVHLFLNLIDQCLLYSSSWKRKTAPVD